MSDATKTREINEIIIMTRPIYEQVCQAIRTVLAQVDCNEANQIAQPLREALAAMEGQP